MAAVNASAVELALTGKASSPLCDKAPEGQLCIPNPHGHSNTYIYCSAHRLISPSPTSCESRMGRMSWCVGGGIGLTHDYCDDPFCRNGGAYAGNGFYCHNNNVVQCEGQNAPRVVEACSDTSFQRGAATSRSTTGARGTTRTPSVRSPTPRRTAAAAMTTGTSTGEGASWR